MASQTPEFNHAEARDFFNAAQDRLSGALGAILDRRSQRGEEWVGPITESQWRVLYAITEKMMEFVLSIRP